MSYARLRRATGRGRERPRTPLLFLSVSQARHARRAPIRRRTQLSGLRTRPRRGRCRRLENEIKSSASRLVAAHGDDYCALPRRQTLRADIRAGSPGARPRGSRPGRAAGATDREPGLGAGAAILPPAPFRGSAGCPPTGSASAETGARRIRIAPSRQPNLRIASPARPCLEPPRCARPFKGYRGRDQARPPRARTAMPAVCGPPSEDLRRSMPDDAAPRFRPSPGPAITLRRRPCRGAEFRRP